MFGVQNTGFNTELSYKVFLDRYSSKSISKGDAKPGDLVLHLLNPQKGQRELARVVALEPGGKIRLSYLTGFEVNADGDSVTLVGQERSVPIEGIDVPSEYTMRQLAARVGTALAKVSTAQGYPQHWVHNHSPHRGKDTIIVDADLLAAVEGSMSGTSDFQLQEAALYERLIGDLKFIPAGRILSGAGIDFNLTLFNCYVIASPKDSRSGINDTLGLMTEIMARGGGVGINLSSLRYRGAYVKGVNGRSSGAISWGEEYSRRTGKVEQGGSRRGALMLMLNDWHPDLIEFINCKREGGYATNCNISIAWSDAFMEKVLLWTQSGEDSDWDLVFPDTSHPTYDDTWAGVLEHWVEDGKPIKVARTVKVSEIWDAYISSNWASAEPGSMFRDKANYWSNSKYYREGFIQCTNPCGEQLLPAGLETDSGSVCNLGHINLAKFGPQSFYQTPFSTADEQLIDIADKVNWKELRTTVQVALRFMDNIYESTKPINESIAKQSFNERRVGFGTLGLAELLIRLGITYGNNELCLKFLDELYFYIAYWSYETSVQMAKERGPFPFCDKEKHSQLPFVQAIQARLDRIGNNYNLVADIQEHGIRNVTLITQAPTGTTGIICDTSTGIEPFPFLSWVRKSRIGEFTEYASVVSDYRAYSGIAESDPLPEFFVTSADEATAILPEDHAATQAIIQRWTDSSISKTCNLPENFTTDDVSSFYLSLYTLGAKGGTIYRNNSRSEQVLMSTTDKRVTKLKGAEEDEVYEEAEGYYEELTVDGEDVVPSMPNIPEYLEDSSSQSLYREVTSGVGKFSWSTQLESTVGRLFVTITFLEADPFEVFIFVGKGGSEIYANCEAIGRLCSMLLQVRSYASAGNKLIKLRDHLRNIGGSEQVGFGPNKVRSLPDSVGKAIDIFLEEFPEGCLPHEGSLAPTGRPPEAFTAVPPDYGSRPTVPARGLNIPKTGRSAVDICLQCGAASLEHSAGCTTCKSCGYSKC